MIPHIVVSNHLQKHEEFLQMFIKEHSIRSYNIYNIRPLKTVITIDQIRSISHEIITQTAEPRLFICHSFDNANQEAQNAFLKTLEEKNIQNYFILLAGSYERIIPTIRSRSKAVLLDSNQNAITIRSETVRFFTRLESSTGYEFLSDPLIQGITREDAEIFIDEFITFLHSRLKQNKKDTSLVIKKTLHYKQLLQNNNLNPQMTVDNVLIFFKKGLLQVS